MSPGNDIDPQLRDVVQSSQSFPEQASPSSTSPTSIGLPRKIPDSSYQTPSSRHNSQQYGRYPQSGPYPQEYYNSSVVQQYEQGSRVSSKIAGDTKRLRACEACRGLKVRCEPNPNLGPCKRCLKSGRSCEITPPSRKRQRKTDTRVSELEKQLADIQAQLKFNGQITSDVDVTSHNDVGSIPLELPYSEPASQQFHPQSRNLKDATALDRRSAPEETQQDSGKRLHSDIDRDESWGLHFLRSPGPPLMKNAPPAFDMLQQGTIMADVQIIADSIEPRLVMSLMREYLGSMLPQKPKFSDFLLDRVGLLQRSKPVLFTAIMMLMLQMRCKDKIEKTDAASKGDGPDNGNQALRVLSEVAMGKSGSVESGRNVRNGSVAAEDGSGYQQHPANAFVNKLLKTEGKEVATEKWFEELVRDFH